MLVTHLDGGLCKRPTYELCLALSATLWCNRQSRQSGDKGWALEMSVGGAVPVTAIRCQYWVKCFKDTKMYNLKGKSLYIVQVHKSRCTNKL